MKHFTSVPLSYSIQCCYCFSYICYCIIYYSITVGSFHPCFKIAIILPILTNYLQTSDLISQYNYRTIAQLLLLNITANIDLKQLL